MTGFEAATSGVAHPHPNTPCDPVEGSLWAKPFWPPKGLAKLGWLRRLKNSARNCAPNLSLNLQVFPTEKSQSRYPESRKMLRPMVPKVPKAGGSSIEFPSVKQPNAPSAVLFRPLGLPPSSERALAAQAGFDWPAENGIPVAPDLKSEGLPKKFQRSLSAPVPLTSVPASMTPQG